MCGIAGIINKTKPASTDLMAGMLKSLAHRGPEDEGVWQDKSGCAILGQRRLAILDLSPAGHQPMLSADGRYIITFNGEIYNYPELKAELMALGQDFRSQSDTEALLYAYVRWGENCLEKINGMFAFAVWDSESKQLFAARDRLGEKPFKYYYDGENLIFASEVKALLQETGIARDIDWPAIDVALAYRFVPAPATGFQQVKKLPAGHWLKWQNGELEIKRYWNPAPLAIDYEKSAAEWQKEIWQLFKDAVAKRLMSDVPIGAFLSGGVDSTSVVAALQEIGRPLKTYVISIGGASADAEYAELAAQYFKTEHQHLALSADDLTAAITQLVDYYDEPFFDASALPSYLIAQKMKPEVTVVLSGDGGDELFGGYDNYVVAQKLSWLQKLLPAWLRGILPALGRVAPQSAYRLEILLKDYFAAYSDYFATWQSALPITRRYLTRADLYLPAIRDKIKPDNCAALMAEWFGQSGEKANDAMIADLRGRLPDGYLAKTDFATMAAAVEIRPPFLDYRLVEDASRLPEKFKVRGQEGKWLWKQIIKDKIPAEIIIRPKTGFSIPLDKIFRHELRAWAEEILLGDNRLQQYFSAAAIEKMWQDHLAAKADYSNHIWSLIMLELWLKKYDAK